MPLSRYCVEIGPRYLIVTRIEHGGSSGSKQRREPMPAMAKKKVADVLVDILVTAEVKRVYGPRGAGQMALGLT